MGDIYLGEGIVDQGATVKGPVKYAVLEGATIAQHEIVAAVTGKKIVVLALWFVNEDATQDIVFESADTAISGVITNMAAGATVCVASPFGLMATAAGEALNMTLTVAKYVSGGVAYVEV